MKTLAKVPAPVDPADALLPALPKQVSAQSKEIATKLVNYSIEAHKAVEAATRLEVSDQESFDVATTVASSVARVLRELETTRKDYTAPLEAAKKKLIELFDRPKDKLTSSLDAIKRKMAVWRQAEQAKRAAEAEAAQALVREEARKLAEATAALGDAAGAQQIVAEAAQIKIEPVKVTGTGALGGSAIVQKRPSGTVTDKELFLAYLLRVVVCGPGAASRVIDGLEFSKTTLNALAKEYLEAATDANAIPGFKFQYIESDIIR